MHPMFVALFIEAGAVDLLTEEGTSGAAHAGPGVAGRPGSSGPPLRTPTLQSGEGGMSVQAQACADSLLADGATVKIRAARPGDFAAVRDMHFKMSPDHRYLRFFSMSPFAAEQEARRVCRGPAPDHAALLAVLDGRVAGCATYERVGAASRSAEVAFAVADGMHRRGIGTLLLQHLVWLARSRGVRTFTAQTLRSNTAMLRVFADSGLPVQRSLADGVYDLTLLLPASGADAA